jgi:hypothetical protein
MFVRLWILSLAEFVTGTYLPEDDLINVKSDGGNAVFK